MIRKVSNLFSIAFILLWSFVVLVQYWNNNPKYGQAFELFQYGNLFLFLIALGSGISFLVYKFPEKLKNRINGLVVFVGLCLIDLVGFQFYYSTDITVNKATASYGAHFGWFLGLAGSLFFFYLVIRVLGNIFFRVFPTKMPPNDMPVIEAAMGTVFLSMLLFGLGLIGGIQVFILLPVFLLVLLLHWKIVWNILKSTFWQPLMKTKDLSAIGVFSFLFLGCFIVFNFIQLMRPSPVGTDSLNLYVNLPNLIAQSGSLIDGHQPYNWSLIMALGIAIFGRVEVTLGLSFLGAFLALIAFFRLCRKRMSINYSALCLLLFFSLPMINFLTYMDMKIDMALAFISMTVLLVFYNWVDRFSKKKPANKKAKKAKKKEIAPKYLQMAHQYFKVKLPTLFLDNRLLILMGILTGFAFGIKLTTLFFFFALMVAIWFAKGGYIAMWSAFFLSFATTFLLKLDAQPLLRNLHKNVNVLQWVLLIIGISIAIYFLYKNKEKGLHLIKISALISVFFVLPILPWMTKNIVETGKITVHSLMNGKKAKPTLYINQIIKQLKEN